MLAYVLWHWPGQTVAQTEYEDRLGAFQRALHAGKPPGFRESAVFRISGAPWLPAGTASLEDWYAVDGSSALDPLNDAAISAPCRAAHDAAARLAAGASAGLYRLRAGAASLGQDQFSYWFVKPAGRTYETFFQHLGPFTSAPGAALWVRQMVLGPTPEFCLRSPGRVQLPTELAALELQLQRVWP